MAFEVASVTPSRGEVGPPSFPVNVGEAYRPTGGYFRADFALRTYIEFAYKLPPVATLESEMFRRLPEWVTADSYHIEARAAIRNPTKDQMRLMMQSLLADRFKLEAHFETREMPVFALTLVKPGKLGPKLVLHAGGPPCSPADSANDAYGAYLYGGRAAKGRETRETFPPFCDSVAFMRKPGGILLLGYRNATMEMVAGSLSGAVGQGRPVIDQTGLIGRYDFTMEWTLTPNGSPDTGSAPPDTAGPTSLEALRDQLGLKVESTRGPVRILVIDKVARPSAN
ncbi:MAG TPA: TIGR03435 family protein [Bryobacteraceae bacterium]|nr:TIGR03435 family protein [Bryobacteraceae bacterium]